MFGEYWISFSLVSFVSFLLTTVSPSPATTTQDGGSTPVQSCPIKSIKTAMGCTASLGFLGQPTQFVDKGVQERLLDGCRDGAFLDAINCIERVLTDCKNDTSEGTEFLRSSLNIEKSRQTVVYFCTNVRDYISHSTCVQDHMALVANCSYEAKREFMAQAMSTQNREVIMKAQCPFFTKAVTCMVEIMGEQCNQNVADIMGRVMTGFEPPVCSGSGSASYNVIAKAGMDDRQRGHNLREDDGNAASSNVPCVFRQLVLAFLLWRHVVKALIP